MPQVNEFSWFFSSMKILFILLMVCSAVFFSVSGVLGSNPSKIKLFYFNSLV